MSVLGTHHKLPKDTIDPISRDMLRRLRPEQQAGPLNLGISTWSLGIRPITVNV